jgi:transcriptional regulator with XRE-family HTH domain
VSFGQRLKAHRVAATLTQHELAERSGMHRAAASGYERDMKVPDWPQPTAPLARLAQRSWEKPDGDHPRE